MEARRVGGKLEEDRPDSCRLRLPFVLRIPVGDGAGAPSDEGALTIAPSDHPKVHDNNLYHYVLRRNPGHLIFTECPRLFASDRWPPFPSECVILKAAV